jgi:hypothetical protein
MVYGSIADLKSRLSSSHMTAGESYRVEWF